jgi:hypothetical protein
MSLSEAMQGQDGTTSSMRLCLIVTVVVVLLVFIAGNIMGWYKGLHDPKTIIDIIDFKPEMKWVLAVAFFGKALQSATENFGIKMTNTTPPPAVPAANPENK